MNEDRNSITTLSRYRGALLGLAVCDALGAPLEFRKRDSYAPLTKMIGRGHPGLEAGTYTDDTAMTLCLAQSLLDSGGHDADDQMRNYVRWYLEGYMSATGRCIGIGQITWRALRKFIDTGVHSSSTDGKRSDGNGSLMRIAPIGLYYRPRPIDAVRFAAASSRATHSSELAEDSCIALTRLIIGALNGTTKGELLGWEDWPEMGLNEVVESIAVGSYKGKRRDEIESSGFVIHTLEAALWAFYSTETFEEGALLAVNLGDDADSVGAVYGQLAGAYYGEGAIPSDWIHTLKRSEEIGDLAEKLYAAQA